MSNSSRTHSDIAIVGMACVFPKAPDAPTYWSNILDKVDAVGQPAAAWGAERYLDPEDQSGERIYTTAGGFLNELYAFDALEFGIMPSSLDGGEPDHFLALKVARDPMNPSTERQLLLAFGVITGFLVWRFAVRGK